jgi:SprT-like family
MSHTWSIVSTQQASVQYNDGNERSFSFGRSSKQYARSSQSRSPSTRRPQQLPFPRQNLRIASSTASQFPSYSMTERDANLGIENGCSRGLIRSSCEKRISRNRRSVDQEAAREIERRFTKRWNDQLTVRILRNLVIRRDELDDNSLNDLLLAADKTIFGGRLSGRVRWEWSKGQPEYEHELLGTTALRPANSIGDCETLIVLSKPLLQNKRFSRDLLLSAFLHELVHCYLFIRCGLEHAKDDGHTEGFRRIAKLIDRFFGQERLHLCNMRANLDYFLVHDDEGYCSRAPSPVTVVEMSSGNEANCIQFTKAH